MKISLIVPAYNEARHIGMLLESICRQSLKPDEVIITDAGSTDATKDVIESFRSKLNIILIEETRAYPGRARNLAIARASGDIAAMTDAGCVLDENWLKNITEPFTDPALELCWGVYKLRTSSLWDRLYAVSTISPSSFEINGGLYRSYSFVSCAMRKTFWQKLGGFPENLRAAEDVLFVNSIKTSGMKYIISEKPIVYWLIDYNLGKVLTKSFEYSKHRVFAGLPESGYWKKLFLFTFIILLLFLSKPVSSAGLMLFYSLRTYKFLKDNKNEPDLKIAPQYYPVLFLLVLAMDITQALGFAYGKLIHVFFSRKRPA